MTIKLVVVPPEPDQKDGRYKRLLAHIYQFLSLERENLICYSDNLADLLINLVEHYNQAIYPPRMLDVLSYQIIKNPLHAPKIKYAALPDLPKTDWKYTAKLTKDILIFIQRIGGLEKSEIGT